MHRTQFNHEHVDLLPLVIWSRVFWPPVTRVKLTQLTQSTETEQKLLDLQSLSPSLFNLWLLITSFEIIIMWIFDRCASQDIWGFKELKQGGAIRAAMPWWVDKNIDTDRVWSSIAVFIAACTKHVHGRDIKLSRNQTSVSEQYTPMGPGIIRSGRRLTLLTETLRNIAYRTVWESMGFHQSKYCPL